MENHNSSRVLMVRPATFFFNSETAENNTFQESAPIEESSSISSKAVAEFEGVVALLRGVGVEVTVIEEVKLPYCCDSVFPNNWFSYHVEAPAKGIEVTTVVLYPMWSKMRRQESRKLRSALFQLIPPSTTLFDLSPLEEANIFLEGTGSLILDRVNRIAFASLSPRTSAEAVQLFCRRMGFRPVVFSSKDSSGTLIYHTNVMMSLADKYCLICLESIDQKDRVEVELQLKNSGKVIIPLSLQQVGEFAGNCLQVRGAHGGTFLAMSSRAFRALTSEQVQKIEEFDKILHAEVDTIERFGGGSVRCMIAEFGEASSK